MGLPASVLTGAYARVLRPVMFASHHGDPERIHDQVIRLLAGVGSHRFGRRMLAWVAGSRGRAVRVAGLDFPGRVGVAAGLDKDASAVLAWSALGFGFTEVGTVTAAGQPGNEKPRVFRLPTSSALLNRMGFNNPGAAAVAANLARRGVYRGNGAAGGPVGISIGKTRKVDLGEAVPDYLACLAVLAPHADYVAVNVSSPNTPGLRSLQDAAALRQLLLALIEQAPPGLPVLVKVSPDLSFDQLEEVLDVCTKSGAAGLIATNTTLSREGLAATDLAAGTEAGGLSGAPLTRRARQVVAFLASRTKLPVIGVGGIMTPADGEAMFDAGAQLIQLYTGFIYQGPGLVAAINGADRKGPGQ